MIVLLYISLGVTYIKTIFINGKEYINTDYKPKLEVILGVPYIESIKIKGKEYINTSYKDDTTERMKFKK